MHLLAEIDWNKAIEVICSAAVLITFFVMMARN